MRHTLVYVDRPLAVSIAAKLVGVIRTEAHGRQSKASVNWLVSAEIGTRGDTEQATDIRELLPEDLVYLLHPHISEQHDTLGKVIPKLNTASADGFIPGCVISVSGRLRFPELTTAPSPGIRPTDGGELGLPTRVFHSEQCIAGILASDDYAIPVYFTETAKYQVAFCHNEPVEVTGVLRWTPPYSPGGSASLNLAIRCAALWLR